MIWPLAALEVVRGSPNASSWSAVHARQALVYGIVTTGVFIALLCIPPLISIGSANLDAHGTIVVYAIALPLDALYALLAFGYAVRCAARANRSELFAIPFVSPIADRLFAKRG